MNDETDRDNLTNIEESWNNWLKNMADVDFVNRIKNGKITLEETKEVQWEFHRITKGL